MARIFPPTASSVSCVGRFLSFRDGKDIEDREAAGPSSFPGSVGSEVLSLGRHVP